MENIVNRVENIIATDWFKTYSYDGTEAKNLRGLNIDNFAVLFLDVAMLKNGIITVFPGVLIDDDFLELLSISCEILGLNFSDIIYL